MHSGRSAPNINESLFASPFSCTAGYLARSVVNTVLKGGATALSTHLSNNHEDNCTIS